MGLPIPTTYFVKEDFRIVCHLRLVSSLFLRFSIRCPSRWLGLSLLISYSVFGPVCHSHESTKFSAPDPVVRPFPSTTPVLSFWILGNVCRLLVVVEPVRDVHLWQPPQEALYGADTPWTPLLISLVVVPLGVQVVDDHPCDQFVVCSL